MKIKVNYVESTFYLGTQDGHNYRIIPDVMPEPDFTEKH